MTKARIIQFIFVLYSGLLFILPDTDLYSQQLTDSQRAQAENQLQTMTPEEIDAKIKSLGMTREEAEKHAKENGIDLQSFLRGTGGSVPASTGTPIAPKQLLQSGPMEGPTVENAAIKAIGSTREFPTSRGLKYFGYDVFITTPNAFEPSAVGPIDPDYIVGPEDVLRVSIWGQVEQQNELTVDKEGRIYIPSAGPVVVSGLTVDEVNKNLTKQLSRSIQGLTATPKTVWLDVTLAKIRPKRVFIMGEVNNPGGYTVNSYATIFNSLFSVGGPTVNGSLREVRLIRGNKIVAKIDLYLYLTGAEKINDIRVQNNDIIYVPVRKNSIYLKGEVRREGIYELLPGENLKKLLEYAGGNLPTSYLERVQVERIIPLKERIKNELERRYLDINYREIVAKNGDFPLSDNDMVTFYSVLDEIKNYVTITGSVFKPGRYQLFPNMSLKDLIQLADSLRPETYTARGELTRTESDDRSKISIPFDLRSVIENKSGANIILHSKDEILIHDISITRVAEEFVEILGSIKKPGIYNLTRNMTLTDLLMLAEGYSEDAWMLQAEIARIDPKKEADTLSYIYFTDLPDIRDTTKSNNFDYFVKRREKGFRLKHRDKIFIRPNPNFKIQQLVKIAGEVNYPGTYALITHNEYLTDLINRSGGKTNAAYLRGGALFRSGERVNVDFQNAVDAPKNNKDFILHEGDSIYIPKKPNSIRLAGEVNNPGILGFIDGEDMWDYIDNAGGLKDSADYIVLYHPSGYAEKFSTGWFGGDSKVLDGSAIVVAKIPPPTIDKKEVDLGILIRDMFAITASVLTILVLSKQL